MAQAALSEFIPKKVTNEQNKSFDGYDCYIHNRNGYAYIVVKLSKDGESTTPDNIQKEIIQILESIKW